MKVRLGFVSNSSAASYVVSVPVVNNYIVTTTSGTTAITQNRTGVETYLQESVDQIGTVPTMVDATWTPWARSKALVICLVNTMPNIEVDIKADHLYINDYYEPAKTLTVTGKTGVFKNYKTSSISHDNIDARQYGTNDYDILEKSEVLKGQTSGATAIILSTEGNNLKVVNVKGSFSNGETIVGTLSGAYAILSSITQDTLKTSIGGTLYGVLMIPNDQLVKIPANVVTISIESEDGVSVKAETKYNAHALTTRKQNNILSIKEATIAQRPVTETKTVQENWTRVETR